MHSARYPGLRRSAARGAPLLVTLMAAALLAALAPRASSFRAKWGGTHYNVSQIVVPPDAGAYYNISAYNTSTP